MIAYIRHANGLINVTDITEVTHDGINGGNVNIKTARNTVNVANVNNSSAEFNPFDPEAAAKRDGAHSPYETDGNAAAAVATNLIRAMGSALVRAEIHKSAHLIEWSAGDRHWTVTDLSNPTGPQVFS